MDGQNEWELGPVSVGGFVILSRLRRFPLSGGRDDT